MIGEDIDIALAAPGDLVHPPALGELRRSLDWKGAFWASSGVPAGSVRNGLAGVLLIIPVFLFRHYVQDKGALPWLALLSGGAVMLVAHGLAVTGHASL